MYDSFAGIGKRFFMGQLVVGLLGRSTNARKLRNANSREG